ncbi:anti-sigma B factor antagonist/stage II sporulation protein AA (anti-sigma F factor antagonist) [Kitasatospora sp. SolWspMP-SS2h]|nr:anti-sigma B factor antagonist/stage II sporulation protein AA (anti-sigma F factor antagonist) [Kitasatospora sp. SolWspMP-SS2h]
MEVVHPPRELDWECGEDFAADLAAASLRGAVVVVDLSRTEFADSSALESLLVAHRRQQERGGRLVLAGPLRPVLRRLFHTAGTMEHFVFADDLAGALERVRAAG